MVLDKYRDQLLAELESLEITEEAVRNWHSHPVTKALKADLRITFIDAAGIYAQEMITAMELIIDGVLDYKEEELTNEA